MSPNLSKSRPESLQLTPRSSFDSASRPTPPISETHSPVIKPFAMAADDLSNPTEGEEEEGEGLNGDGDDSPEEEQINEGSPMLRRYPNDGPDGFSEEDDPDDGLGTPSTSRQQLEGTWEAGSGSPAPLTRGQKRRVYGGGRHGDDMPGGGFGAGEVAGMVLSGTLSPTPLLLPHAAALLGLPLFIPLLFLTAALSWFAYIVLGVEARYVGARSWTSLSSAVFPHRLKTHRLGELITSLLVLFVSTSRGVVSVVAASEVVVDLFLPAGSRHWSERAIGVGVVGVIWLIVPLIILPLLRSGATIRRRPSNSSSASALFRLPGYISFLCWPLALLILGVRLKTLNRERALPPSLNLTLTLDQPIFIPNTDKEIMGLSIWGGISLLVFSLSAHQNTFNYLTSLARPPSTASRSNLDRRSSNIESNSSIPPSSSSSNSPSNSSEGRRNQWPLASALGVFGATLNQLGWSLVGYLGIDGGGREGNLLSNPGLPRGDPWLVLVRLLVLIAILGTLENSLDTAYNRVSKGLIVIFGGDGGKEKERRRSSVYMRIGSGVGDEEKWDWKKMVARVIVWVGVVAVGVVVTRGGESGEGMISVAEVAGCIGSGLLGFLLPSLYFVALFHLRKPRSIFITDPTLPNFAGDTLLMRKEREVQRKLSGRRIWQDVCVFGGLLPFGTVIMIRGIVAIATKED